MKRSAFKCFHCLFSKVLKKPANARVMNSLNIKKPHLLGLSKNWNSINKGSNLRCRDSIRLNTGRLRSTRNDSAYWLHPVFRLIRFPVTHGYPVIADWKALGAVGGNQTHPDSSLWGSYMNINWLHWCRSASPLSTLSFFKVLHVWTMHR